MTRTLGSASASSSLGLVAKRRSSILASSAARPRNRGLLRRGGGTPGSVVLLVELCVRFGVPIPASQQGPTQISVAVITLYLHCDLVHGHLLTGNAFPSLYCPFSAPFVEESLCASCSSPSTTILPVLVLMAISVITSAFDNDSGKVSPSTTAFHFEADDLLFIVQLVSVGGRLKNLISRCEASKPNRGVTFTVRRDRKPGQTGNELALVTAYICTGS